MKLHVLSVPTQTLSQSVKITERVDFLDWFELCIYWNFKLHIRLRFSFVLVSKNGMTEDCFLLIFWNSGCFSRTFSFFQLNFVTKCHQEREKI